jgi:hypothetical protein
MREIRDPAGTLWTVFDVVPSTSRTSRTQLQAGYAEGWLCFQCETERRRQPGVPRQWSELPDDDILALIEQAAATGLRPLRNA